MGESEFSSSFQTGAGLHEATKGDFETELNDLKKDFTNLRKDMGDLISSIMALGKTGATSAYGKAQEEVSRRVSQLGDVYGSAKTSGAKAFDNLRTQGGFATESIQHTIEERPMTSVIVALGVGIILGKFLSGR